MSHGCHLNIVAYSLFSSSPREEETEDRQRDEEENERAREKRGRKVGDRARWRREKRKKRRGKLTEKIRGRGGGGGETEITVMFSRFVYTPAHTCACIHAGKRVYENCRAKRERRIAPSSLHA